MRVKAAIALGIKEVPCVIVELSERKEKILNLALNRISGRWDNEKLGELITELGDTDDVGLSGFDKWELEYYNQGPEMGSGDVGDNGIQGESENDNVVLIFSFDDEKEAERVSKYLNDGKYVKGMSGQKLIDLIEQVNNA